MNHMRSSAASFRSTVLASLLWVYVLLVVVSSMAAPLEEFDDAIPLVLGVLVQQGATPTIDFRSFYPPLGPYVTAAGFNLFGRTVIATRVLGGGIYVLVMILLGRLLARHFQPYGPRFTLTMLLVAVTLGRAITLPAWPGFGLSVVALLVYFLAPEGGAFARLNLVLSGALTGLVLLYRVNFGGYVALIIAADLVIEYCTSDCVGDRAHRWKDLLFKVAAFVVPMLACVSILCLRIYGNRLVDGISDFTLTSQKLMFQYRFIGLRWSFQLAGVLLFPAVWLSLRLLSSSGKLSWRFLPALAVGVGVLILAVARGDHVSVVALLVLCQLVGVISLDVFVLHLPRLERAFLIFYVLQLHYYLTRADGMHLRFLPFAAVLLLPFLWPEWVPSRELGNIRFSHGIEVAGFAALICIALWHQSKVSLSNLRHGMDLLADVALQRQVADADRVLDSARPGAAWASVYSDADEIQALKHLRQVTTNADPIFVGVQDHSRIFYNNLRLYWLSGRPIGVREFQLEDKIASEAAVQREIIRDLDQNHVKWAIIDRDQPTGDEAFVRRAYSGATLLDAFVRENFKEESRFGRFAILRRATESLP
jgi:hypothetical protein